MSVIEATRSAPPATAAHDAGPDQAKVVALRWRTRDTTRHLLNAYVGGFGIALITGALLWLDAGGSNLAQVMLVSHLTAGALGLIFFIPYLFAHLKDGKESWRNLLFPFRLITELRWEPYAGKRLHGHLLMWGMWLVLLSGLAIAIPGVLYLAGSPTFTLPYGLSAWLLDLHAAGTVGVLALMLFHVPAKERQ